MASQVRTEKSNQPDRADVCNAAWIKDDDDQICFPVAIVGLAFKFPGIVDMQQYRKVLVEKLSTYGPIPEFKWSKEEWHTEPGPYRRGYMNSDVMGSIGVLNAFDNTFFSISPKEATLMDKHQPLIMELTQLAFDDAGIKKEKLDRNTAVYVSTNIGQIPMETWEARFSFSSYSLTGGSHSVSANRVNYVYDVMGPSVGIEAGNSSALNDIHLGVVSLWHGECTAVIVGSANCVWSPQQHVNQCATGRLSTSGQARPFDQDADGKVRSEGCGLLLLKPLRDAVRDGDHVYCVIRASRRGHLGTMDLAVGDPAAASELVSKLYESSGIDPDDVDYVETSASGQPSDDLFEAEAIAGAFRSRTEPLRIGSCMANVGHAEHASGMASIAKAVLMLGNREYYPQANLDEVHPELTAADRKLQIQRKHEKYDKSKPMLVGVNSISSTGQIVHLVLEEYRKNERDVPSEDLAGWHFGVSGETGRRIVVVLTAKCKAALQDMARQWLEYTNANDDAQVVASWLASRRNHYSHRLIVMASSADEFRQEIRDFLDGKANEGVIEGTTPMQFNRPKICFVYPGQGQQWPDMGRSLYANEPVYRNVIDSCDEVWKRESGYSFLEKFNLFVPRRATDDGRPADVDDIIVCQPAIVAHQLALSSLLQHWGFRPDMVIGHSLGEVGAAYVAGTMTLEECMVSIFHRASTQMKLSGAGTMAAARLTPEEGERFCSGRDDLFVACYNSTESVTLAGTNDVVRRMADENPKKLKLIRVKAPYHTIFLRPVRDEYFRRMEGKYSPKWSDGVQIYSSVTKDVYRGPHGIEYWWDNIEKPVFFAQANEAVFRDHGGDVFFVEVSASPTLLSCVRQTAKRRGVEPAGYATFGARGTDDWTAAVNGLAKMYLAGFDVDWNNVTRNCARYVDLPKYPFQRTARFFESEHCRLRRIGQQDKSYVGRQGQIDVQMHPFLADCRVNGEAVVPASSWVEFFIEAADSTRPSIRKVAILKTPNFFEKTVLGEYDKLFVELVAKDDELRLQANADAWDISPEQPRGVYATAVCAPTNASVDADWPTKFHIDPIYRRCSSRRLEETEVYDRLSRAGWQYGRSFRMVKHVNIGEKESIGMLAPEINKHERIGTLVVDGAFQIAQISFSAPGEFCKLTRIDAVRLNCEDLPRKRALRVYCKLVDRSRKGFRVDVYITDENGKVLAMLLECCFELAHQKALVENNHFPRVYSYEPEEAVFTSCSKMDDGEKTIFENWLDSYPSSQRLRGLRYIDVDGWTYDIGQGFVGEASRRPEGREVEVTPEAFTRAGRLVQCSGTVSRLGGDVTKWRTGDRVLALRCCGFPGRQIVDEDDLVSIAGLSWEEGSEACLTFGVARYVVNDLTTVGAGDVVRVTDRGASRLGEACARLARLEGATVVSGQSDEAADVVICPDLDRLPEGRLPRLSDRSRVCLIAYGSDFDASSVTDEDVTAYHVNVERLLKCQPDVLKNRVAEVVELREKGALSKLNDRPSEVSRDAAGSAEELDTVLVPRGLSSDLGNPHELALDDAATYLVVVNGDRLSVSSALVRWLARRGAGHVVLVSDGKRTLDRGWRGAGELKRCGAVVHETEADLTGAGRFAELCRRVEAASLPAVRGVWFVAEGAAAQKRDPLSDLVPAAVLSARTVARESGRLDLDHFVLLSTGAYDPEDLDVDEAAVAKEFASLAIRRKLAKLPGLAVAMPLNEDSSEVNADPEDRMNTYFGIMELLVLADRPPAAVFIVDKNESDTNKNGMDDARKKIIGHLSKELLLPVARFDDDVPLKQYGVDGLFGRDLADWLKAKFGLNITVKQLIGDNLAQLLAKLNL